MPASHKLYFDCETYDATNSDQAKNASKTNQGGFTTNFTTTTGKGGTLSARRTSSNVKGVVSGYQFGSTDGYDLSNVYTRTNATAWGFVMAWSGCSNYNDKYIFHGGSNGNYLRFVDSGELQFRSGGNKGANTSIPTDTGNGPSTAHTFGSGLEVIVVQVTTGTTATIWNIDGDKIVNGVNLSGGVASLKIESLFHDNTFSKNPGFMLHDFFFWEGQLTDSELSGLAASYARLEA